jgi:alpha-galactosidase
MSCHVTETPNAGTQLITSPEFRFGVALNGVLGYEFNLFNLSDEDCTRIKGEIDFYRSVQDLILKGDFYRLITPFDNPKYYSYVIVSKDKKRALFSFNALMSFCNSEDVIIKIHGLCDDMRYRVDGKIISGKVLRCVGIPMPKVVKSGSNYTILIEAE